MICERIKRDLEWWREVFLLAAGQSKKHPLILSGLIDCLIPVDCTGENVSKKQFPLVNISGLALAETKFHANVVREKEPGRFTFTYNKTAGCLKKSIISANTLDPQQRAAAGNTLAKLGDPRLEVTTLDQMQFCFIPAGDFWMGSKEDNDEQPAHQNNTLNYGYWMSRFPITNAQFKYFVDDPDGYRSKNKWWTDAGRKWRGKRTGLDKYGGVFDLGNHPVVNVTWYEAQAFTTWLTDYFHRNNILKDRQVVLPSEAQWEKAARGGSKVPKKGEFCILAAHEIKPSDENLVLVDYKTPKQKYPWGDKPDANKANYDETKIGSTSAVGCFPGGASPYGCEEMSGNVWEWCLTKWRENYNKKEDNDPKGEDLRAGRGGSFSYDAGLVRCSFRYRDDPVARYHRFGFRVALSPIPKL